MTAPVAPKAVAAADKTVQLDVTLLGRDYKVACKESERAELVEAVALLDRRMREIRDTGKIAGVERVAVMAALNLAHELMRATAGAGHQRTGQHAVGRPPAGPKAPAANAAIDADAARRRIGSMHSAIDALMAEQEKLY
jgi:cell division protein ZapA